MVQRDESRRTCLSVSLGKREAVDQQINGYRSVVVNGELSVLVDLLVHANLTYDHKRWVVTERMNSWIRAAEISFL